MLAQLEVHGVALERIVVMLPFDQLSQPARDALLEVEKATGVKVDWIAELLGLTVGRRNDGEQMKLTLKRLHRSRRFGGCHAQDFRPRIGL